MKPGMLPTLGSIGKGGDRAGHARHPIHVQTRCWLPTPRFLDAMFSYCAGREGMARKNKERRLRRPPLCEVSDHCLHATILRGARPASTGFRHQQPMRPSVRKSAIIATPRIQSGCTDIKAVDAPRFRPTRWLLVRTPRLVAKSQYTGASARSSPETVCVEGRAYRGHQHLCRQKTQARA